MPIIRGNQAVAYVSDAADQSLLCEVFTDEAVKFIKAHQDEPFFLYLPHAYVHNPRYARPEILAKAEGDANRANVEEVDTSVGRVLDTLRELDLDRNTLVLFTSDNGGAGGMSMGPLRGGKGGPKYEGHMREPTIAWWPGTIPPGAESDEIVATTDILPSLARLTGASKPTDRTIDGKDALDVLLGKPGAKSPHDIHYYEIDGIRRGDWKLVRVGRAGKRASELYDLKTDVGEQNDLAARHPDIVKELEDLLAAHAKRIAADTRPAAFVESAKPILSEPGDLPRLRELVGKPDVKAANENSNNSMPVPGNTIENRPRPPAAVGGPGRFDISPAAYSPAPDDVLIADFEGDDYGGWTTTGTAFGDRPARAATHRNRATGFRGKGLVNTYLNGDKTTGTLTSPPFSIERKHLNFLIGGGNRPGKAGLRLIIEGKPVRSATGRSPAATSSSSRMITRFPLPRTVK